MHWFLKFIFGIKLHMFRTVPLSIIRSFSLYTQQWYMSYKFADHADNKPVWHTPLLCVQWKTPNDGQRNCPKHVEFYSKNKFEKSVHLVGFIRRIVPLFHHHHHLLFSSSSSSSPPPPHNHEPLGLCLSMFLWIPRYSFPRSNHLEFRSPICS